MADWFKGFGPGGGEGDGLGGSGWQNVQTNADADAPELGVDPTTPMLVDEAVAVMRARDRRKHADHPGLTGISVADVLDAVRRQLTARAAGANSPFPFPVSQ